MSVVMSNVIAVAKTPRASGRPGPAQHCAAQSLSHESLERRARTYDPPNMISIWGQDERLC